MGNATGTSAAKMDRINAVNAVERALRSERAYVKACVAAKMDAAVTEHGPNLSVDQIVKAIQDA